MTYASLDDVAAAFVETTTIETKTYFVRGRIIADAIAQGFDEDDVLTTCSSHIRRTVRTIRRYYSTYRTFSEPLYGLPYEFHAICSDLVDYRQTDKAKIEAQQEQARQWLLQAAAGDYSTRTLNAAIAAAEGKQPDSVEVLLDGVPATVMNAYEDPTGAGVVEFRLPELPDVHYGAMFKLTLVRALAVETEAA